MTSTPSRLCYWVFLPCVVVSGFAGYYGWLFLFQSLNPRPGRHGLLMMLVTMPCIASLSFLLLYSAVVLTIVWLATKASSIRLEKRHVIWGSCLSAMLSLVIGFGWLVLALLGLGVGGVHDSL